MGRFGCKVHTKHNGSKSCIFATLVGKGLRATAMTRMYNLGVPEKLIADKSGHRSIDGLRAYEHPSSVMEKAAGEIIADPTKSFQAAKSEHEQEPPIDDKPAKLPGLSDCNDDKPESHKPAQLPGFSGLSNCNITFNISYGK